MIKYFVSKYTVYIIYVIILFPQAAFPQSSRLFWTESRGIYMVDEESIEVEKILTSYIGIPYQLVIDTLNQHILWADESLNQIFKSDLNGANIEVLYSPEKALISGGICVDVANDKVYWSETSMDYGLSSVWSTKLDGTNLEKVFEVSGGLSYWRDIELSPVENALYLHGSESHKLFLDDKRLENQSFLNHLNFDIELDIDEQKVYWVEGSELRKANLDGSEIEVVVIDEVLNNFAVFLSLDLEDEQVFFVLSGNERPIYRFDLNTSTFQNLDIKGVNNFGIKYYDGNIYWIEPTLFTDGAIYRAQESGDNVQVIVSSPVSFPYNLRISPDQEFLYWSEVWSNKIKRVQSTGGQAETIQELSGWYRSGPFTVDFDSGTLFWQDSSWIHLSNIDESDYQVLFKGSEELSQIEVDPVNGKLYFISNDQFDNKIVSRSNIDGTEIEEILSYQGSNNISIDTRNNRLFLGMSNGFQIREMESGALIDEIAIPNMNLKGLIHYDPIQNKIYFTIDEIFKSIIYRVNIDGSQLEEVISNQFGNYISSIWTSSIKTTEISTNQNPELGNTFDIYPNPFFDEITISIPAMNQGSSQAKVYVIDLLGRLVDVISENSPLQKSQLITWDPPANISPGVYFIWIDLGDSGYMVKKSVKI